MPLVVGFAEAGERVVAHDPYVPALPDLGLQNVPLEQATAGADAIVLVTAHPGIDYSAIARHATLFIDLRGVTRGIDVETRSGSDVS